MPQLDVNTYLPQIVWLLITFTALFLVMWRVVVPRIADVFEARQKRIDDNLDKAADSQKEAEAALEAYEASLDESRARAQALIDKAADKITTEAEERTAKLSEELDQKIAENEAEIREAVAQAMESVPEVALEAASAVINRLTGEAAVEKDVVKAVTQALKGRGG